jgi:hypothetical protein
MNGLSAWKCNFVYIGTGTVANCALGSRDFVTGSCRPFQTRALSSKRANRAQPRQRSDAKFKIGDVRRPKSSDRVGVSTVSTNQDTKL